jgi:hypothetical protein
MHSTPPLSRQKNLSPALAALLSLALGLLASGCATSARTRTGFLPSYDHLQPVPACPGLYAERDIIRDSHPSIHVAPVAWQVSADTPGIVDEREQTGLCVFAQKELERAFAARHPTPAAGQPPLELRSAITRVETSNPALNVVTTLALFMPLNTGGICLEWKLVDPASERIIAQGVAVQTGKPWQVKASFETLGHARAGLTKISAELASYLPVGQDP